MFTPITASVTGFPITAGLVAFWTPNVDQATWEALVPFHAHHPPKKMNKAGTINPVISIIAQWKYAPNVRSYDLIGAYFSGVSIASGITSKITYTGGTIYQAADVTASNGFGSVLKLPTNGANIVVSSTFAVSGHGTIYGSYQHAKSSISLNNAKSFTISFSGLGNVHYFSNMNIRAKYDAMQGVNISI